MSYFFLCFLFGLGVAAIPAVILLDLLNKK